MAKTKTAPTARTSAAPGTKDTKAAAKVDKIAYPGLVDSNGNEVKLAAWPEDYDAKLHKPLRKNDFENEATWLDHRAEELEERAKKYREEADTARKLGSAKERQKAKKLLNMQARMAKLVEQLKSEGMDVDEILATGDDE